MRTQPPPDAPGRVVEQRGERRGLVSAGGLPDPPAAAARAAQHGGVHGQPPVGRAALPAQQVPHLPDAAPVPGLQHLRRDNQGACAAQDPRPGLP